MGVFSGSSTFTGLLERATSQLQLEPDWATILQICDSVRQQDVSPKFAVSAIKKKMFDRNPHVAKYALTVLEACMKNCGSIIHDEIATKDFMDEMRNLIKNGADPVKDKVLGLIQTWSHAFRNEPKYKIVQDTFNLMKMEGCKFPAFNESDAMFSADSAPAWAEGDVCHMCRVKFGTFIRQHHCRNCGQVFCKKCSSKESIIPQFGIEKEVRVCDPCYLKINPNSKTAQTKPEPSTSGGAENELPPEYLNSPLFKESQEPPKKNERDLQEQEEEELQLAMALSLSQDEAQKEVRPSPKSSLYGSPDSYSPSEAPRHKPASQFYNAVVESDGGGDQPVDPELARYLNRSYWEDRKGRTSPSAPEAQMNNSRVPYSSHIEQPQAIQEPEVNDQETNGDLETDQSSETLVNNFRSSVEMLMERMQDISGKGKHVAMDATVQSLFQTVSAMHPQLLRLVEQQEQETGKYEGIQERLGLVKEARATLEGAREAHREKLRQQELEQDMLRRMQIEQKLELMRQQKAEYLAYQQRIQAERQIALEQQQQQLRYQMVPPYGAQYPAPPPDGSPYSSMVYAPPAGMQPPQSGSGAPPAMPPPVGAPGGQPSYSHPMPQGYAPQGYQPEYGGQSMQPPPPKTEGVPSQEYPPGYGVEGQESQPPLSEYQQQPTIFEQPLGIYSSPQSMNQGQPSQGYNAQRNSATTPSPQQAYTSPPSSAPAPPPPQYNQASMQQLQYGGPQQYQHPHANTPSPTPHQQYQHPQNAGLPADNTYNPSPQGDPNQGGQQPGYGAPPTQGGPPQAQPPPHAPPGQAHYQQLGAAAPNQGGYHPQQQPPPPQGYEPQPQYQPQGPPQYYGGPPPQQQQQRQPQSGPPPQRQMSDLELISFD
ncbi:hepatocyte growth factor-regulated tyrosine kinase substrate isoform X2 [Nematostella vectensis]|uniref:hepatocyte growth factor-regulated tyrosine kinase substrate isoform X2 n=1 Tax=Nematostella vectensis TaxID=45351 RepID=UPI002076F32D|nr:hepatocyte growth factor-regulated tyrosine kinase substrate isoform X2 [Nematostella vectensis]